MGDGQPSGTLVGERPMRLAGGVVGWVERSSCRSTSVAGRRRSASWLASVGVKPRVPTRTVRVSFGPADGDEAVGGGAGCPGGQVAGVAVDRDFGDSVVAGAAEPAQAEQRWVLIDGMYQMLRPRRQTTAGRRELHLVGRVRHEPGFEVGADGCLGEPGRADAGIDDPADPIRDGLAVAARARSVSRSMLKPVTR